jgi:hypothetical protein
MTNRTAPAEPDPPTDYPHPRWADEPDPYYVPPSLRAHYAAVEPTGTDRATFDAGVEVFPLGTSSPTTDKDTRGFAILEHDRVAPGKRLTGRDGWHEYLHSIRLDRAVRQHRIDEAAAATEAAKPTCPLCGARDHRSSMFAHELPLGRAVVCRDCEPHVQREVDERAHRAWLDERAEQLAALLDG